MKVFINLILKLHLYLNYYTKVRYTHFSNIISHVLMLTHETIASPYFDPTYPFCEYSYMTLLRVMLDERYFLSADLYASHELREGGYVRDGG